MILDDIYLDDGRLIGVMSDKVSQLYAVHADRLGTPETVSDQTQSFVLQESYTPFGLATVSGPQTLFVRAPGQFFEPESGPPGLYQNGAREYWPTLGRYIESDPIGLAGGINSYAYVGGNPLSAIDLDGLQAAAVGPSPVGPPIPSQYIPGTPQNQQWTQWSNYVGKQIEQWLNNELDTILQKATPNNNPPADQGTQADSESQGQADDAAQRQAEHDAYKNRCKEPPPPNLDPCELLQWLLQQAKDCVNMQQSWDDKWQPGRHAVPISQWGNRVRNLEQRIARECKDCPK